MTHDPITNPTPPLTAKQICDDLWAAVHSESQYPLVHKIEEIASLRAKRKSLLSMLQHNPCGIGCTRWRVEYTDDKGSSGRYDHTKDCSCGKEGFVTRESLL